MKFTSILMSCLLGFASISQIQAAYTIQNGSLVNIDSVPEMSVEEHYNAGVVAYKNADWYESSRHFYIVMTAFRNSSYAQESTFYLGVCHFNVGDFDCANSAFSMYLQGRDHPRLFIDAIQFKFAIAERLRNGARCRLFGQKLLPKWSSGETLALKIYDEVIAALPSNDLAAQAFYSKALLLRSEREYRDCIDTLQMALRRFPKHELSPEYYLLISRVYLDQCRLEFQNPDILAFAEINLKRFQIQFPREERLVQAEETLNEIRQVYGSGLAETGLFYERKGKPRASILYYQSAIVRFPETSAAELSRCRLRALGAEIPEPAAESLGNPAGPNSAKSNVKEASLTDDKNKEKIDWIQ